MEVAAVYTTGLRRSAASVLQRPTADLQRPGRAASSGGPGRRLEPTWEVVARRLAEQDPGTCRPVASRWRRRAPGTPTGWTSRGSTSSTWSGTSWFHRGEPGVGGWAWLAGAFSQGQQGGGGDNPDRGRLLAGHPKPVDTCADSASACGVITRTSTGLRCGHPSPSVRRDGFGAEDRSCDDRRTRRLPRNRRLRNDQHRASASRPFAAPHARRDVSLLPPLSSPGDPQLPPFSLHGSTPGSSTHRWRMFSTANPVLGPASPAKRRRRSARRSTPARPHRPVQENLRAAHPRDGDASARFLERLLPHLDSAVSRTMYLCCGALGSPSSPIVLPASGRWHSTSRLSDPDATTHRNMRHLVDRSRADRRPSSGCSRCQRSRRTERISTSVGLPARR